MTLVHCDADIDNIRPYKNYKFLKYPKNYPALISFESQNGGLMGDWELTSIIEIPENVDVDSFVAGVTAKAKEYGESVSFGNKIK
jgi:hypothetical protein